MTDLVLASTSRYRAALLARLGLPFQVAAPRYEEAPVVGLGPAELACRHAEGKALSLATQFPNSIIIGSDQVAALGNDTLSKPGTLAKARAQLGRLQGREHHLWTAVAVWEVARGVQAVDLVETRVGVRPLTEREIERYLLAEQPFDCAGSYRAEERGISILEYLRSDDPTAVIGLPLIALCRRLRALGVVV